MIQTTLTPYQLRFDCIFFTFKLLLELISANPVFANRMIQR